MLQINSFFSEPVINVCFSQQAARLIEQTFKKYPSLPDYLSLMVCSPNYFRNPYLGPDKNTSSQGTTDVYARGICPLTCLFIRKKLQNLLKSCLSSIQVIIPEVNNSNEMTFYLILFSPIG